MMTDEEIIAVVQAKIEKKNIESRLLTPASGEQYKWRLNNAPVWNFADFEYRVAPEPFRKWLVVDKNGIVVAAYSEHEKLMAINSSSATGFSLHHVQEIPE